MTRATQVVDLRDWRAKTGPRTIPEGMTAAAVVRAYAERPTVDMFYYQRGSRLTAYQVVRMQQQVYEIADQLSEHEVPAQANMALITQLRQDLNAHKHNVTDILT